MHGRYPGADGDRAGRGGYSWAQPPGHGDVDVQDLGQVIWAWSCHCRPEHDVIISPVGEADLEKPCTYPRGVGARLGIDATTKSAAEGYERDMPDRVTMDKDVLRKIEENWAAYGFKK